MDTHFYVSKSPSYIDTKLMKLGALSVSMMMMEEWAGRVRVPGAAPHTLDLRSLGLRDEVAT